MSRHTFAVSLLSLVLGGALASDSLAQQSTERKATSENAAPTAQLPNFSPLVERYGPAVVNVEVIQRAQSTAQGEQDPLNEFFRRFGIPPPGGGGGQSGSTPQERGSGSGFILTPDGYILSNAHVVADADEVTVRLTDRREFPAKVIGADPYTDVALLKIPATNLPTVKIGDPNKLRPGEWVVAIGSPFGLENTATAGIVSATARAVSGDSPVPFIQSDVAVNPGNSGGPLFNLQGEVVGINSMIFSRTGGYMGLSFAIPIDVATNVRDQLIKTGRVVRGRIGVAVQEVTAPLAASFGLDKPRGALVSAVEPKGPADKAGIKSGDVILSVNGQAVDRSVELSRAIARMNPGSRAKVEVWRDRKRQQIEVDIGEMKGEVEQVAERGTQGPSTAEESKLGLQVRALTAEEQRLAETEGTIVVQQATGPAARAGLQQGDIIIGVAGKRIESIDQLRASAKRLKPNESIALLIERNGAQIFVPVRVG